ncbi:flavin reductase family protein [Phycicoccus sp. CSK15P-2]|uniref:flavin reductase family protein n=1 Tax=Phycicoccus sp. CSK15P-2 TaxID=2807627 RepID=UPI00194DED51|nr:flavin reductase family protein [Phycicoccus sp. CSK15P-2]MBM6405604.1 flavin reductase family protein [Phycicoccus sp. CSK15P-2]
MPVNASPASPAPALWDDRDLRDVLGTFATGITVIATGGPDPVGMTTNSFTSVSLDPPLVLFCARRSSKVAARLEEDTAFTVNVLTGEQEHAARHFASSTRGTGVDSFRPVEWEWGSTVGAPVVTEASSTLECRVWKAHDGGDHVIYIGEVLALHRHRNDQHVLVYLDGDYHRLSRRAATRPRIA